MSSQVYQGGHVDLQNECKASGHDRLLCVRGRSSRHALPLGTEVGISIDADGCGCIPGE